MDTYTNGDEQNSTLEPVNRRSFLGSMGGILIASAYVVDIPEHVSGQIMNDSDTDSQTVASPDGNIQVSLDISTGTPVYSVSVNETTYIESSSLGFDFQNQQPFGQTADGGSGTGITITGTERGLTEQTWNPIWDQYERISTEYRYLRVGLKEVDQPNRTATLWIRVYNDGIGLRIVLSEDFISNSESTVITSENTQFNFADDYTVWWIRNEMVDPRFEQEYRESSLSDIEAGERDIRPNGNSLRNGAHTPLTIRTGDGTYLSVHEADLTNYATLSLAPESDDSGTDFSAELAPLPDGTKVASEPPLMTPWRTIQIGSEPGDLIESSLIPLLNDQLDESVLPTASGEPETDWITPRKYVGIWWTMIAGNADWEYKSDSQIESEGGDPAAYIHGARTERMKRYMKFASENGIDSVLAEGWNQGWDSYYGNGGGFRFNVDESSPDFDVREVLQYGSSLKPAVEMTMHNETGGNLVNYEDQIENDDIFAQYDEAGISSLKNGYVSDPGMGHEGDGTEPSINHHCQIAVNHHELVTRVAARNRQLLERHEADKPTGKRRKYPNLAATETVRAQEFDGFNALADDLSRDHHVKLPFTRMLAGPTSFQPGIFDLTFNDDSGGQVQTTRAKQLAMYPSYNAGMQMVADRIEAYLSPQFEPGELLQATAGDLRGFVTADNWRNAFGTTYIAVDPTRVDSGSTVSWTVTDVPSSGTYDLHLRYASDAELNTDYVTEAGKTQATLRVNESREKISPSFTSYWDDWQVFTTSVELEKGENTIALELQYDDTDGFSGDVGGFHLNAIAVTREGKEPPIPESYTNYTPENENFETKPEFSFLESVPAGGWDDTVVVDAQIGEYTIIAREKDDEWYLGVMTGKSGGAFDIPLRFLAQNEDHDGGGSSKHGYVAEIYSDGIDAACETNPTAVRIDEAIVDADTTLLASVVESGGQAVRLRPATGGESRKLSEYARPEQQYDSIELPDRAYTGYPFTGTITGSHVGEYIGGEELNVYANSQQIDTALIRFSSQKETDTFELVLDEAGEYDITLGQTFDEGLPEQTVDVVDPYAVQLPDRYSTYASAPAEFGRTDDRLLVNAAGEDIESYVDEYGAIFVDDGLEEGGTVTAVLLAQENTDDYAKAGVMIRNDITGAGESAGYVVLATSPLLGPFMLVDFDGDGYLDSGVKSDGGGFIGSEVPYSFPTHLRLEKDGTTFTGSVSVDGGSTFTVIGTADVTSANAVQDPGMFATSHDVGTKSEVAFRNFDIT